MDGLSDSVILRLAITVIHKTNLLMERGLCVGEFQCYIGENTLESCLEILSSILPNVFSVGGPLPLIKFNIPGGVLTTLKRYIEIRSLMDPDEDFESLLLELTIGSFDDKILTLHSSYTSRRAAGVVMEIDDGELTESERDESDEVEDVGKDIAVVPEENCTGVPVEFGDEKEGNDS